MSINSVTLSGNLTRDPILSKTQGGKSVCQFTIAHNERFKDRDGNKKEDVSFLDVVAYGKLAEVISENLGKGCRAAVDGKLKQDRWEKDGVKHSKVKIVAHSVFIIDWKGTKQKLAEEEMADVSDTVEDGI